MPFLGLGGYAPRHQLLGKWDIFINKTIKLYDSYPIIVQSVLD
jgi:hypothetical protein